MVWFLLKVLILVVIAVLIRGTLPRYRVDQLVTLHWKTYIFIYITFTISVILFIYFFSRHSSVVEHQTENLGVRGSNPFVGIAIKILYWRASHNNNQHYLYSVQQVPYTLYQGWIAICDNMGLDYLIASSFF